MTLTEEFQRIMEEYDAGVEDVQKNRKRFDGFFGLGHHPADAACHEVMDQQVSALCARAAEEADAVEAAGLVEAVLKKESGWEGPAFARLMLNAIQRHTLALIPSLDGETRRALADWYGAQYPRRQRLPVQEEIFRALKK